MNLDESLRRSVLNLHSAATGRQILACLDQLNQTQWLNSTELKALQQKKLLRLLQNAYQYVPYYQRIFDQVGFKPEDICTNPDSFYKLPILNKSLIREHFSELLTTDPIQRKQLSKVTTSGSTGQPLVMMQNYAFRDNVTADIQRHLGWAGWKMGQLHAYLWGANFEETTSHAFRSQLIDWEWNRFLTNAFTLTEEKMEAFAQQVLRRRPHILFGYASCLHQFALFVLRKGYRDITFDGIMSSAEVLPQAARQVIEDTFKCRVFNRYGTKELGGIACECESHNGLHISAENNLVEILNNGHHTSPGETGSLIITNLNNLGMPFIRYSIGDEAAWLEDGPCPCGRGAPKLESVEGRIVEHFITRDGRASWAGFAGDGYSSLFAQPNIKQFQIIQEKLDYITVLIANEGEIPEPLLERITNTLQAAFGSDIVVEFKFVDKIPLLPSGKHQYAISKVKLPPENQIKEARIKEVTQV
jgi:phenylacetate-CoA ligase